MIRHILPALTGIGTLSAVLMGLWTYGVPFPHAKTTPEPLPPSIAQIQSMSDLATTRVHISDVFEHADDSYKGRWSLHGDVILGVDLSTAQLITQPEKRHATLILAAPHLVSAKVDHERSQELSVKSISWWPFSSSESLKEEVWRLADRRLQLLGQEPGYMQQARLQAEHVLTKLFDGAGWRVDFQWREAAAPEPK